MITPVVHDLIRTAKLSTVNPEPENKRFLIENVEEVFVQAVRTLVTPEFAAELLTRNTGNRKVIKTWVDQLAQDMTRGRWQENGETIIVSRSGKILDGQHRLLAVIKSGRPVYMLILFGISDDRKVMASIDQGKNRTVANILQMAGSPVNSHIQWTGNLLASLTADETELHFRANRPLQAEFLEKHLDEIVPWAQWSRQMSGLSPMIELNRRRGRSISSAALNVLALHMTRRNADPEVFQEFIEGALLELPVARMAELTQVRMDLLKLVNRRLKNGHQLGRSGGGSAVRPLMNEYALYIRVYNRYVRNEPQGKLQLGHRFDLRYLDELPDPEVTGKW